MAERRKDDGTLAFLKIPSDKSGNYFHCPVTTQRQEVNRSFYVMNYTDVETTWSRKTGARKVVVLIADDPKDKVENMRKFFTGSKEIQHILDEIRNRNAFPRKVTLKADGNRYYMV